VGAFELQTDMKPEAGVIEANEPLQGRIPPPPPKIKDECIVAYKVYDSCRRQSCLTFKELGAPIKKQDYPGPDEPIDLPGGATGITIEGLKIAAIDIGNKKTNPFRAGYWDVDVRYTFEYRLTFTNSSGEILDIVDAASNYKVKTTLFGSLNTDLVMSTDLPFGDKNIIPAAPFIWVDAKAVDLDAKIQTFPPLPGPNPEPRPPEIHLTIGLFMILKLFRLVHLNVQSKGFCSPQECKGSIDVNPCDYFSDLDFPMDMFMPPQKPDFKPCNHLK